jgi:(1->4)-alpha-D-glucan 1-alpha-D-glucosylmutase
VVDGRSYPSRNEEYLLYQTLVGSWPLTPTNAEQEQEYRARIVAYMHKAMREAKVFTSWLNPSERHERAMTRFVDLALSPDNTAFRDHFLEFQRRVARYGIYNSLAQLTLKVGAPGVPDFYQGTELWDFSLVDPDNRRPVDYERRRALLEELTTAIEGEDRASLAARLFESPCDDRVKLFATMLLLRFRRANQELFQFGAYEALEAGGARREHLFAFARTHADRRVVVVVPRLIATLLPDADALPVGERVWADTWVVMPAGAQRGYRHALTHRCVEAREHEGRTVLRAAEVFEHVPIAFLESSP